MQHMLRLARSFRNRLSLLQLIRNQLRSSIQRQIIALSGLHGRVASAQQNTLCSVMYRRVCNVGSARLCSATHLHAHYKHGLLHRTITVPCFAHMRCCCKCYRCPVWFSCPLDECREEQPALLPASCNDPGGITGRTFACISCPCQATMCGLSQLCRSQVGDELDAEHGKRRYRACAPTHADLD